MNIQDEILKRIKKEITEDPYNLGYAGKTDEEIQEILNNPFSILVVSSSQTPFPCPMNRILSGVEFAPNAVVDKSLVRSARDFIEPI